MKKIQSTILALLALLLLAPHLPAQEDSNHALWHPITYKRVPGIEGILLLTPEQITKLDELLSTTLRSEELRGLEGEEWHAKEKEKRVVFEAGLLEIFTPEQVEWRAQVRKIADKCEDKAQAAGLDRATDPEAFNARATEILIQELKDNFPEANVKAVFPEPAPAAN